MNINKLIGEDVPSDVRKFVATYFHKGNIQQSVSNLLRKEKSILPFETIEKEQDLNFIVKVCKEYMKYQYDTSYDNYHLQGKSFTSFRQNKSFALSSGKTFNLMVMMQGLFTKKEVQSDYEKKLSNIKEMVRQIEWKIDTEKNDELLSMLEKMNKEEEGKIEFKLR